MKIRRNATVLHALLFSFTTLFACNSAPTAGSELGACYGNGTCNDGLVCASSICVQPPTGGAEATAPPAAAPAAAPPATPSPPAPIPDAPAAANTPAAVPPPSPVPVVDNRVQEATTAYAVLLLSWNNHNETLYFERIAPTLDCWYSDRSKSRDEVRAGSRGAHFRERGTARLVLNSFTLLGEYGDRLVFVDDGAVESTSGSQPHRKIIAMANTADGWQMVGEIGPNERSCPFYASLPQVEPARANPEAQGRSCTVSGFHDGCGEGGDCQPRPLNSADAPLPCGARDADVNRLSVRESEQYNGEVSAEYDRAGRITRVFISYSMANEGAVEWRYSYSD